MFKNFVIAGLVVLIIGVLGFVVYQQGGGSIMQGRNLTPITRVAVVGTATTSPEYLATSTDPITQSFRIGNNVSNLAIGLITDASSTDSVFNHKFYNSFDGIDWYDMENGTTTTGTTSAKFIDLGAIDNKYFKYEVSRTGSQSGGAIYVEAIIK